jgi:hypothetical protein
MQSKNYRILVQVLAVLSGGATIVQAIVALLHSDVVLAVWALSILAFIVAIVLLLNSYERELMRFKRGGQMMLDDIPPKMGDLLVGLCRQAKAFHDGHDDSYSLMADYLGGTRINDLLTKPCTICHFPRNVFVHKDARGKFIAGE